MPKQRPKQRATTGDRGPPEGPEILTTEQIGPNMSKMPNGNLLCKNVPIARVGWMIYGPGETPIEVDPATGFARVYRGADELFHPACIGSFMGAAVVNEHPEDDVTPKNWKDLAKGFATTNVYRGEGDDADVLLADLVITSDDLIKAIMDNKREVSCGYDADYTPTEKGQGLQTNIIGNHIALVERGRCGPRCAIGDQAFLQPRKEKSMATTRIKLKTTDKRAQVRAAFRQAVADAAEGLLDEGMGGEEGEEDGGEEGATHIHIHAGGQTGSAAPGAATVADDGEEGEGAEDPTEARFGKIEQALTLLTAAVQKLTGAEKAEAEQQQVTGDEGEEDGEGEAYEGDDTQDANPELEEETEKKTMKSTTGDSAALQQGFAAMMANAEILVPGFRMPTFDAKAKRKATVDNMCKARRRVMDLAYATKDGKELIDSVAGVKTLDLATMDCAGVATLFRSSAGAKKLLNNRAATGDAGRVPTQQATQQAKQPTTIAALNEANAKYWATRQAQA